VTDAHHPPVSSGADLRLRLVPEAELTEDDHARIRGLLVAAFPEYAELFAVDSWWGARPEYRLWLEEADRSLLAHLEFERRTVLVGDQEVPIAGTGEVAVHPTRQGQGLGCRLMHELRRILRTEVPASFGFLGCRDEVVDFYEHTGWVRIDRPTRYLRPNDTAWVTDLGPNLILPALAPADAWPDGDVDLRGMPW
jgi:predicted N-acetyltransferase YhbS